MASTPTDRLYGLTASVAVKAPCLVASTANITTSSTQVIDGITVSTGKRVLVWQQTNSTENGIYEVRAGTWARTADFDGSRDVVQGTLVYVTTGTLYGGIFFSVTSSGINVPDSSTITFAQTFFDEFRDLQALTFSTGDIIYYSSGSSLTRLAIGASGTLLTSTGGRPQWLALASQLTDFAALTFSTGDLIYYTSGSSLARLAIGASATVLTSTGGRPQWVALAAPLVDIAALTFSTGDLVYYSSGSSFARLALGASDTILTSSGGKPAWGTWPQVVADIKALTPATGDIFYYSSGSSFTRLALGASDTVLTSSGGKPVWGAWPQVVSDIKALTPSTGDIFYYSSGSSFTRLALGASGTVLTSTGGAPKFVSLPAGVTMVSQYVSTEIGTTAAMTAAIPFDNTIPQVTEGTQIMSLPFTPRSTASTVMVEAQAFLSPSAAENICIALFSSTSNAIAAQEQYMNGSGFNGPIYLRKHITTGITSTGTTFSLRAGPATTLTTVTFNGQGGLPIFGGVFTSFLSVTEYTT